MRPSIRRYLRLGFVSWIPAIIAIAGAVSGGSGGGGGGGGGGGAGAATYVPTGQPTEDANWQSIMQGLMQTSGDQAGMLTPFLQSAFGNTNDLYTRLAGLMGQYGGALGSQGQSMFNAAGTLRGSGDQVYQMALDPENALRDRTQGRIVDASRASTSARGIGMGAEAAGLEDQAVSNFNIDWNDRALGRATEGLRGQVGAYDAAGRSSLGGAQELGASAQMFQGAGALPFELANLFSGSMQNGVYNPQRDLLGNIQSYLGLGQSATSQAFGQNQTNLNNVTSGLGTIFGSDGWNTIANSFKPDSSGSGASSWVDETGWGGG